MATPVLIAIFVAAAAAVWLAGIRLSGATDALDRRFGLGEAMGGLLLLSIATNLPEIAITVSAAFAGNIDLAAGNLLGGVAIQTVVLVALDRFGRLRTPLSRESRDLTPVLEGALVIAVLMVVTMGAQLDGGMIWRIEPAAAGVFAVWLVGILLISAASRGLPWTLASAGDASTPAVAASVAGKASKDGASSNALVMFGVASVVTLAGGVALERSGDQLAGRFGMEGVLFGATVLAAATAIPEVATGIASVRMGNTGLAFSDIFGGNAFLPTLFLVACLISGDAVIAGTQGSNIYLAALGCLLTAVYIIGLAFHSPRRIAGMGVDSLMVLLIYAVGIWGLTRIA